MRLKGMFIYLGGDQISQHSYEYRTDSELVGPLAGPHKVNQSLVTK